MKLKLKYLLRALIITAFSMLFTAPLFSRALTGHITNGTTGKPSRGDEVILIRLGAGMEEVGHTQTDAQGRFSFTVDGPSGPYLVRAIHQEVTYHKPAPAGTDSVSLEVYDVGPKVEGVHAIADLMYIQASRGNLGITRIFAVDNTSSPPRTQMNDSNFEFSIPPGAAIDEAQAQTAGGQAVKVTPRPQAQKGRYAFVFPLRPGQTEFQVTYHLAYGGKATIDPSPIYPLQHFVAILPRSMSFAPAQDGLYQDRQPPDQPDAVAKIATNPQPGQRLSFDISGEGLIRSQDEDASNRGGGAPSDTRPGGGLGAPIDAPDPLDRYRGYLLGGLGIVLAAGAVYVVNRPRLSARETKKEESSRPQLLEVLKEELFQLELEHQQGQVSDQEYAKAKAALDDTLARAIQRSRQTASPR